MSRLTPGPTSAIAPNLLAGTSPFPALLQESQTGIAGPSAPDLHEREGGGAGELAVSDLGSEQSPDQTNDIGHPAGLITQGPSGSSFGQAGGRSLPENGNLLPPEGLAQPLTAPSFEIKPPIGTTREGEYPVKASLAGRSTGQTFLHGRVNQSIGAPGPVPVQGDDIVETATTHSPKNAETFDKSKIPDGREVSPRDKASNAANSGTRRAPQAPGNSDATQPLDEAKIAASAVTRREGQPLRSEKPLAERLANPIKAKAALNAGTRLDPERRRSAPPLADLAAGPRALPPILSSAEPTDAAPPSTASTLQTGQPLAALAANAATLAAPSGVEPRAEVRPAQPIETVINQLAEARESARASRPELTLRHHEFGTINMRIETAGAELRATLASRDPGFVPAVQAALAERAVAASSESAPGQSSRGNDQSSNQNSSSQNPSSQGNSSGFGASSEGRYGSSLGSGQGSSQPYWEQSGGDEEEGVMQHRSGSAGAGLNDAHGTGIFA